jgi:Holliday junction resolvase-like predicted endonuclease
MFEMFVKSIHLDDAKRIVVQIHEFVAEQFLNAESKKMLKDMTTKALGEDFVVLEAAKTSFRVTVKEGRQEICKQKIEDEIRKMIDMAMSFMEKNQEGSDASGGDL